MDQLYPIIVIGGGAAGFFAAIHAAAGGQNKVVILEKTTKVLSKVRISGGGRCNVTHQPSYPRQFVQNYPRGGRSLIKMFDGFGAQDTIDWFESRGVSLKVEADGRVFPNSDSSATIIDCLLAEAKSSGVDIKLSTEISSVKRRDDGGFDLSAKDGTSIKASKIIIATGGSPKIQQYEWLRSLGLEVVDPVPSLFTFNVPGSDLKELMGLSVPMGRVQIPATDFKQSDGIDHALGL